MSGAAVFSAPPCMECGQPVTERQFLAHRAVILEAIAAVAHRKCFTATLVRLEAQAIQ